MTTTATPFRPRSLVELYCHRMVPPTGLYTHLNVHHPLHAGTFKFIQTELHLYILSWSSWGTDGQLQLLIPAQSATFTRYAGPQEDDDCIYVLHMRDGSGANYYFQFADNVRQHAERDAATINRYLQTRYSSEQQVEEVVYNEVQMIDGVPTVHGKPSSELPPVTTDLLSLTPWDLVDLSPLHRCFPPTSGIVEHIASYLPVTDRHLAGDRHNEWHNAGTEATICSIGVPAGSRLTLLELTNGQCIRPEDWPWTMRVQVQTHAGAVVYEVVSEPSTLADARVCYLHLAPLNLYLQSQTLSHRSDPTNQFRVVVIARFHARGRFGWRMETRLSYTRSYTTPLPRLLIESATRTHRDEHLKPIEELYHDRQGGYAQHDHHPRGGKHGYALSLPPEYIAWRTLANTYVNPHMSPPPNADLPIPSPLPRRFRTYKHKDGTTSNSDSHLYIPTFEPHVLAQTPQMFATQLILDDIALRSGGGSGYSWCALGAPRMHSYADKRSHLARDIAQLLYPATGQEAIIESRIQYQHLLARLSLALRQHVFDHLMEQPYSRVDRITLREHEQQKQNSTGKLQSLNDQEYADRLQQAMSPAVVAPLPMPVTPSTVETLQPFFQYLASNEPLPADGKVEFERGIVYRDARMDLCKQVVGPGLIQPLIDALAVNQRVKHFLLGNNIIGVTGSKAIAAFIRSKLQSIETWYLAGNCIDEHGIQHIAQALTTDTACQHLWLKRNPILPAGAAYLADMLTLNRSIRVLDLDNCGLQDEGIEQLFNGLRSNDDTLQHLYLDGNGITSAGCKHIADYLQHCTDATLKGLESLFMSINLIGDEGAIVLSQALRHNKHLKRLNLSSNGIQATGIVALCDALLHHPAIMSFEVGYASQSVDLGGVPNRGTDRCVDSLVALLQASKSLRVLNASFNHFTAYGVRSIMNSCIASPSLLHVTLMETGIEWPRQLEQTLHQHLARNVQSVYGAGVTRDDFLRKYLWQVRNIAETQHIESLYRTRGFRDRASRRQMVKYWSEHDIVLLDSEEYGQTYQIVKAAQPKMMSQKQIAYVTK